MNAKNRYYKPLDPERRASDKQVSRDADADALRSGKKSPDDLRRENGHFALPSRVRLDKSSLS